MKWLYIGLAILGALAPTIYIYLKAYNDPDYQGGAFDLGLIFLGLGLGFMVVPLGVGAGLLVAAFAHIGLYLLRGRPGRPRGLPGRSENETAGGVSWVTQAGRGHHVASPRSDEESQRQGH